MKQVNTIRNEIILPAAREFVRCEHYDQLLSLEEVAQRANIPYAELWRTYQNTEFLLAEVIVHLNQLCDEVIFSRIHGRDKENESKPIARFTKLFRRLLCVYPEMLLLFKLNFSTITYTFLNNVLEEFYSGFESRLAIVLHQSGVGVEANKIARKYLDFLNSRAIEHYPSELDEFIESSEEYLLSSVSFVEKEIAGFNSFQPAKFQEVKVDLSIEANDLECTNNVIKDQKEIILELLSEINRMRNFCISVEYKNKINKSMADFYKHLFKVCKRKYQECMGVESAELY